MKVLKTESDIDENAHRWFDESYERWYMKDEKWKMKEYRW